MKTIIISLGGSVIIPKEIDEAFLKEFKKIINTFKKEYNFVIVCGGGSTARKYITSGRKLGINEITLDTMGIGATQINAELVAGALKINTLPKNLEEVPHLLKEQGSVVCGGFFPGLTSDQDSVVIAELVGSDRVINISNVAGVYDKDPRKYKNAKMYTQMTHKELIKLASKHELGGGEHFIFDLAASKLAERTKTKIIFIKGLLNLKKYLKEEKFIGTTVS